MMVGRGLKRLARASGWPLVFCALTGYFCWNATQGAHGLVADAQRKAQLQQAESDLAAAQAERNHWEIRVSGLRDNNLNLDTLDERARAMLNLAHPNEIIVQLPQNGRLF